MVEDSDGSVFEELKKSCDDLKRQLENLNLRLHRFELDGWVLTCPVCMASVLEKNRKGCYTGICTLCGSFSKHGFWMDRDFERHKGGKVLISDVNYEILRDD